MLLRLQNLNTVHFAIGEITTKNMETLLRYIEKIDHSRVSLVTAYHPVLKHIDWQHPKKELPILYRNEKMTDLFNDPQMAAYINPLKNIKAQYLVRARLDNSLPNGGLKLVPRSDAVCARTALKRTVWYSSPITGPNNKISGSTSCRTDNSIYISSFIIMFTLINTLGKHVTSA